VSCRGFFLLQFLECFQYGAHVKFRSVTAPSGSCHTGREAP
jgi:hypothetical protein